MPKVSETGKLLLTAVKREQLERQAARTALALVRCGSSSVIATPAKATSSPDPLPEADILWERNDFQSGNLIVFARGEKEAITIRKSPEGRGWYIDFGGSVNYRPK